MNERQNAEKEYQKAVDAADALSKRLDEEIQELRSKQAEYERYKKEAEEGLETWKQDKTHKKYYRAKAIDAYSEDLSRHKRTASIFKVDADAKAAEKVALGGAIRIVSEKIGRDVNISTETLLAATQHLNKMINLIDPPFNFKKLPGIILITLGSLSALTGLGLLIAGGTVAAGIFLLPMITIPALFFGGAVVGVIGAMWFASIVQNDAEALKGCKNLSQIKSGQEFPSDDALDQSTVYYKVEKVEKGITITTRWCKNDGTPDGTTITDQAKCQQIINLRNDKTVNYFDEIITLLGYPSLTVQALNVEKAALAKAIPTQLASPVEMPSSSTPTTGTGKGSESTLSTTPFTQPPETKPGEQPAVTPTQQPGASTKGVEPR